jgi:hypothetical protein
MTDDEDFESDSHETDKSAFELYRDSNDADDAPEGEIWDRVASPQRGLANQPPRAVVRAALDKLDSIRKQASPLTEEQRRELGHCTDVLKKAFFPMQPLLPDATTHASQA